MEDCLKAEISYFANCILEGKAPPISATDGVKALMIAEAALKSSECGKPIMI